MNHDGQMNRDELDRIDWKIIRELQKNGRISNAELARKVGLSQSPCWMRVRRLEARKIIAGYQAIISQKALGRPETIIVHVTMERHGDQSMSIFEKAINEFPEVVEASVIAGDFDFQLKVAIRDTSEYEQFLREKLYKIPGVRQIRSTLQIRDILNQK